ncbi:MAG TPA: DUF87 domain-containing protein [Aggregatilineales bacterium]|nr:DUF87 domain-containing protein [Aggregatilineales bacterium]
MPFIEAPTTFYMGRRYDPSTKQLVDEVVYYDSRDLTTHAVVVGMTGSGKTGICIDLLEEAVLDNIPAIVIDPKGDITNLLLTFPNLRPEDFAPWINPDDARRAGLDPSEYARDVAQQWKDGLASWSIVPQRIQALKNAAQFSIYTPGSDSGLPVSIVDSLKAPHEGWAGNEEANRERISGMVTALMALVGRTVDPVKDREHVLISNIFENAWKQGHDLSLEDIIVQVQQPPFAKLGVFDIDQFFPEKDRNKLALELNNIVAAPSFQSWISGEPLDVSHLFYTEQGRPRVSIFYIAHLSEAERSFMITLLLENMLSWMRSLSGTTSLRGILYFDEVFGHFPPAPRNPPTKEPLLRLLKQARAFGVGVVLATQNPGDLDYKGLSNAGTWLIGKLQTDNDRQRVLGGLQAATTAQTDLNFDNLNKLLSGLAPRVFVLHNIHDEGGPILVHSRWSMSYLRGPLTRQEVRTLMESQRKALGLAAGANPAVALPSEAPASAPPATPVAPIPPMPPSMPRPVSSLPYTLTPATAVPASSAAPAPHSAPPPPPTVPEGFSTPEPKFTPPPTPPGLPEEKPAPKFTPPPVPPGLTAEKPAIPTPAAPRTFGTPPSFSTPPAPPIEELPADPASEQTVPIGAGPISGSPAVPSGATAVTQPGATVPDGYSEKRPVLPSTTAQFFLPTLITTQQAITDYERRTGTTASSFGGAQLLYRPVLLAQVAARYLDRKTSVEEDQRWAFQVPNLDKVSLVRWGEFQATPSDPTQVSGEPFGEASYGAMPPGLTDSKRMTTLKAEVVDYVYRSASLVIFHNATLDIYGKPRENRRDFLIEVQQKAREARDAEIDTTTKKFDKQLDQLDEKMRKLLRTLNYDKANLDALKREDLYTTGEAVLGLLKGRTTFTLSRMSRTRRYKTQAQERTVGTEADLADLEEEMKKRQQELQDALKEVNDKWGKIATTVEEIKLTPMKKDLTLEIFGIGWTPIWYVVLNGQSLTLPAYSGTKVSN